MAFEPETPPATFASEQNEKEFHLRQAKLARLKAEAEKPVEVEAGDDTPGESERG